jgi:hypothetical protein
MSGMDSKHYWRFRKYATKVMAPIIDTDMTKIQSGGNIE